MDKDKKVLALDIDGTLVNSKKEITRSTREALLDIQKRGHIIVLASGRPYQGMRRYAEELELAQYNGLALCMNGAQILDCKSEKTIYENFISNKYMKQIYDYAVRRKIGFLIHVGSKALTGIEINQNNYMDYEAEINSLTLETLKSYKEEVTYDVAKCLMSAEPDIAAQCEKELADMFPELLTIRSEPFFIEVTNRGVDKGESLKVLMKYLDNRIDNLICCGDGFNDTSMIKAAGIGVAMDNAQQIVKDNADYITGSCDDDGLVEVVNRFIL